MVKGRKYSAYMHSYSPSHIDVGASIAEMESEIDSLYTAIINTLTNSTSQQLHRKFHYDCFIGSPNFSVDWDLGCLEEA